MQNIKEQIRERTERIKKCKEYITNAQNNSVVIFYEKRLKEAEERIIILKVLQTGEPRISILQERTKIYNKYIKEHQEKTKKINIILTIQQSIIKDANKHLAEFDKIYNILDNDLTEKEGRTIEIVDE